MLSRFPVASTGLLPALVVSAAGLLRLTPWPTVLGEGPVNFRGYDAWYHLRVIDHLVANFPHRLTLDPYAAAGGQYVPLSPLFDLLVAGVAWVIGLGHPNARLTEIVAALVPPLCGALTTGLVYLLGARLFDRRAGLLAALLVAIMPGHLLERTLLGFTDHHCLEVVLACATLLALVRALASPVSDRMRWAATAGAALGAYLLTWSSGAFLVLTIAGWAAVQMVAEGFRGRAAPTLSPLVVPMAGVALLLVLVFQPPALPQYRTQVATLVGLAAAAAALDALAAGVRRSAAPRRLLVTGFLGLTTVGALAAWWIDPHIVSVLLTEIARLWPGPAQLAIIETRPLLYPGETLTLQPLWDSFRIAGLIGPPALLVLLAGAVRNGSRPRLLMGVWTTVTIITTLGQNRFGYYLAPNLALLTGWALSAAFGALAAADARARPWGRRAERTAVGAALAMVLIVLPCLGDALRMGRGHQGQPPEWRAALTWLREETPDPFGDPDVYRARYDSGLPTPEYSVLNAADLGYWITRTARRVPVANPTHQQSSIVARFFSATSREEAAEVLASVRARYAIVHHFLALSLDPDTAIMTGAFESILWQAGRERTTYYEPFFERAGDGRLRPVWLFYPSYYRSMAVHITAFGGAATPEGEAWVISFEDRSIEGVPYREIVASRRFDRYADAVRYLSTLGPGKHRIAGRDPRLPCVPLGKLAQYHPVYEQPAGDSGSAIRIFEYRPE